MNSKGPSIRDRVDIQTLFFQQYMPLPGLSWDGHDRPVMLIHEDPPGLSLPVNDSYQGSLQGSTSLCHLQSFTQSITRKRQRDVNGWRIWYHAINHVMLLLLLSTGE